tara:strand:+ start:1148 stop:1360 length:213 start_codon:yes stop_codon:yes gene_type:complete
VKNIILELLSMVLVVYLTAGALIIPLQFYTDLGFEKSLVLGLAIGAVLDTAILAYVVVRDIRAKNPKQKK